MIKTDFIKLYEELDLLTEAKQDTVNFTNFIMKNASLRDFQAQEWVKRFDKLKPMLKAPENDYYYWIKKNNTYDLFERIKELEHEQETKKLDRSKVAEGAELVNETENWKIYHITNYEASRVYGRDAKWCITGINNYGSRYWDQYTRDGYDFYFIITKGEYDPRGTDSKFAFAINDKHNYYEIYDQHDDKVSLDEIPYYEEVEIPGKNLDNYSTDEPFRCEDCDEILSEDEVYWDPRGWYPYCETCWDKKFFYCHACGRDYEQDDGLEGADGNLYCRDCWADRFYECPQCWEVRDIDDAREGAGDYYCQDCWEELFIECDDCGEVFYKEDITEIDGRHICVDCLPNYEEIED